MSATAANLQSSVPVVDRKTRWIVVQVDDGTLFVEPGTLKLDPGWVGEIVWFVFTNGYTLPEEGAIVFHPTTPGDAPPFNGTPMPDPSRVGCWSTAASNNNDTDTSVSFSYTITVVKPVDPRFSISGDPVIENEPQP